MPLAGVLTNTGALTNKEHIFMENGNQELAEKFFRGECSSDEIEQTLAWFDTPEGQYYLENRLDRDLRQVTEMPDPETYHKVPTPRIKSRLDRARRQQAERRGGIKRPGKQRHYSPVFATAASMLLLVAVSLLLYHYSPPADNEGQTEQKEIVYRAGAEEHKDLLLSDGSSVRLNSNSQLIMPKVFTQDKREVTLKGEAYFEIQPNPEKSFIVITDLAVIRVLGTSFNVKTSSNAQNMQVAVREGKVSFQEKKTSSKKEVVLAKDQLGYLDVEQNEIKVEQVAVDNYLSWMTRRLTFESTPFRRVCTQLERIYDIGCFIRDEQLNQIRFTANFERESLEKTLEIISGSLEISYQMEGNSVTWMKSRESVNE